jgi:transposase
MASDRPTSRRRYGAELKAQVMAECDAPGASVAKVAMAHGINANVVHRWRQLVRQGQATLSVRASEFVPVSLVPTPAPAPTPAGDIQIQLRRGATAMTITWPVSASADFAGWMRELLR